MRNPSNWRRPILDQRPDSTILPILKRTRSTNKKALSKVKLLSKNRNGLGVGAVVAASNEQPVVALGRTNRPMVVLLKAVLLGMSKKRLNPLIPPIAPSPVPASNSICPRIAFSCRSGSGIEKPVANKRMKKNRAKRNEKTTPDWTAVQEPAVEEVAEAASVVEVNRGWPLEAKSKKVKNRQ